MSTQGVVIVITGPSCAGKSTLERLLIKRPGFVRIVSHTTREPRPHESNGDDYFFVTREQFKHKVQMGHFVETTEFGGNFYGGSIFQFKTHLDSGKNVVIVVEPEGRQQILDWCAASDIPALPVFVSSPPEVIAARFMNRVLGEFMLAAGTPRQGAAIESASSRLAAILTKEIHWKPVMTHWSLAVPEFNGQTQDEVVSDVIDMINGLRQKAEADKEQA